MTRNPNIPLQTGTPVRVAVITEDPLLRTGLTSLLAQAGEQVEVVELDGADVALWDAGADPARTPARLEELRGLQVPVLAAVADPAHAAPALAAGAKGVVLRAQVGPGIAAALVAIRSGLTVIDGPLAASVVPNAVPRAPSRPTKGLGDLTERERQVVQLLAEGLSNKLIADRLGISDHTAKFHVNGVMMKLGSSTRTEAVVEAMRRGLIKL